MVSISPFRIDVAETALVRLRQRLELSDFPSEIADAEPWSHGPPVSGIKRLADYWQHQFNWRGVEEKLNRLPQFTVDIEIDSNDSKNLHFAHQRSNTPDAISLLFLHGWPGSFVEVTKILPLLVDGGVDNAAFHVVAPSLVDLGSLLPAQR